MPVGLDLRAAGYAPTGHRQNRLSESLMASNRYQRGRAGTCNSSSLIPAAVRAIDFGGSPSERSQPFFAAIRMAASTASIFVVFSFA